MKDKLAYEVTMIKRRKLTHGFKIRVVILGEPGTGKSIIHNFLFNALRKNGYPVGLDIEHEHEIVTRLKD